MDTVQIAKVVFDRIKQSNSNLQMEIEAPLEDIAVEMVIHKQLGLDFDVCLNLQNEDELQLSFGPFCGEWFPCTDAAKAQQFEEAANGVLCGTYRLEITKRGNKPVKALLQKPEGNSWLTVYAWRELHLPVGKKTISHVQNHSNT